MTDATMNVCPSPLETGRSENATAPDAAPGPSAENGSLIAENRRLEEENEKLAEEVLRGYEQVNFIFDVSAEIAVLRDADEIRGMLLAKLRQMFDADSVFLLNSDGVALELTRGGEPRRGRGPGGPIEPPPATERAWERLRESARIFVTSEDPEQERHGTGTAMWGRLDDGSNVFDVVSIVRAARPFDYGDMLVLDSALAFSGHILSNLRLVEQLKRMSFESVRALVNAIDQKDAYTSGHSERVGFLARITGQWMGLTGEQIQAIEWAGLLHDVGKIGIPERVLNKPGKLTEEEYARIQDHPSQSYEILKPVASLELVLDGVLYHHENYDGTGYPEGLAGDAIPLNARIIHVVDVFDALTSTRSYRRAYDTERAFAILLEDAGTKMDPEIVEPFIAAWDALPTTHPEGYARWFGSRLEVSA